MRYLFCHIRLKFWHCHVFYPFAKRKGMEIQLSHARTTNYHPSCIVSSSGEKSPLAIFSTSSTTASITAFGSISLPLRGVSLNGSSFPSEVLGGQNAMIRLYISGSVT